jgi:predicted GNAT family N-acyltransferase
MSDEHHNASTHGTHPPKLISGSWQELRPRALPIRWAVFVEEQKVPAEEEVDELDDLSLHVVAVLDGQAVATGRLCPDGRIGRMAVRGAFRQLGWGAAVMKALLEEADRRGLQASYLHAQCHALAFYERFGFRAEGPVFDEAGIPHRLMRRTRQP